METDAIIYHSFLVKIYLVFGKLKELFPLFLIAEQFVLDPNVKSLTFNGRTGKIKIDGNRVERIPQCFERSKNNLVPL